MGVSQSNASSELLSPVVCAFNEIADDKIVALLRKHVCKIRTRRYQPRVTLGVTCTKTYAQFLHCCWPLARVAKFS